MADLCLHLCEEVIGRMGTNGSSVITRMGTNRVRNRVVASVTGAVRLSTRLALVCRLTRPSDIGLETNAWVEDSLPIPPSPKAEAEADDGVPLISHPIDINSLGKPYCQMAYGGCRCR